MSNRAPFPAGLLVVGLVFLAAASSCSKDPAEKAYQACMEKVKSEIGDEMRAEIAKNGSTAGMGDAMVNMAEGLAKGMCETIKTSCKQDPNGIICKTAIEQYK